MDEIKREYRKAYAQLKANTRRMAWLDWLATEAKGNAGSFGSITCQKQKRQQKWCTVKVIILRVLNIITISPESIMLSPWPKTARCFIKLALTAVRDDGKRLFVASECFWMIRLLTFCRLPSASTAITCRLTVRWFQNVCRTGCRTERIRVTFDDPELERHRSQLSKQVVFQKRSKTSTLQRSLWWTNTIPVSRKTETQRKMRWSSAYSPLFLIGGFPGCNTIFCAPVQLSGSARVAF